MNWSQGLVPSQTPSMCTCWNEVVGVSLSIRAGAFPLLSLLKPISRELAEEEHPLISRGIAKKSTASFQHVHTSFSNFGPQKKMIDRQHTLKALTHRPHRLSPG